MGHLGRVLGDGLAEALGAGPPGGQDAALATFPGGLLVSNLIGLAELFEVLGQDVMKRLIGGAHQPQIGIAIEHAQQEVGVTRLAQGQKADRLTKGGIECLVVRGNRAQTGAGSHHDLRAGQGRQDSVPSERLGDVGHGQPGASKLLGNQVGQVERGADPAGSRR